MRLVRSYSSSQKLADDLCHELELAEDASERGTPVAEQMHLRQFEKILDKRKAEGALTDEEVATLLRLVAEL